MKFNKKKMNKFLSNLITFVFLIQMSSVVFAAEIPDEVLDVLRDVLNVLLTVAGLVCVFKIVQIGIMFMTSSAADKSNAKTAILPWLIGTIVCFGADWVGGTVLGWFDKLKGKNVLDY